MHTTAARDQGQKVPSAQLFDAVVVLHCVEAVGIGGHTSFVLLHNAVAMSSLSLARVCQSVVSLSSLAVTIAVSAHQCMEWQSHSVNRCYCGQCWK